MEGSSIHCWQYVDTAISHVAQSCYSVIYATSHSDGASQNSTLRNFVVLGPIITKFGMTDYVGDPYPYANFR